MTNTERTALEKVRVLLDRERRRAAHIARNHRNRTRNAASAAAREQLERHARDAAADAETYNAGLTILDALLSAP